MRNALKWAALLALLLGVLCGMQTALADTVQVYIPVEFLMSGDDQPDDLQFAAVLQANKPGTPMPASSIEAVYNQGKTRFGPITYGEPNDYLYTLYEADNGVKGYTYDTRVYTVTVQVTSDARGKLTATVYLRDGSGNKPDRAIFENSYRDKTKIPKTGYGAAPSLSLALLLGQ